MGSKSVRTTAEPNLAFPKVLAGCRVLVVEDNFLFASTLVRALEHMGCQVIGPCSGVAEAASSLGAGDPHLGILDITVLGGTTGMASVVPSQHAMPTTPPGSMAMARITPAPSR